MSHLLRDSWRMWRKTPGVTFVIVASLALGIGTATACFSIVDQLLLRPLRIERPDDLYQLTDDDALARKRQPGYTYKAWESLRQQTQIFDAAFARRTTAVDLSTAGETDRATAVWVSGDAFRTLGVGAERGRAFGLDDDRAGGGPFGPVAVVSHQFWLRRFGGREDAIGRALPVGSVPFTVVGVLPASFEGFEVGRPFDVALPMATEPLVAGASSFVTPLASGATVDIFVRLRPGLGLAAATEALRGTQAAIRVDTMPDYRQPRQREAYLRAPFTLVAAPQGDSQPVRYYRRPLTLLMGLTLLVLLAVCGNVAAVLLAQGEARRYEFAVRLVLGTSRGRLGLQQLVDGVMLATAGAVGGLVLASWLLPVVLSRVSGAMVPFEFQTSLDWRGVLLASIGALTTGALCSLAPLRAARDLDASAALSSRTGPAETVRLGRLVSAQLVLSSLIVASAVLLWASYQALVHDGAGVRAPDTTIVDLRVDELKSDVAWRAMEQMRTRVAALPSVEEAALAQTVPLNGFFMLTQLAGDEVAALQENDRVAQFHWTSPGYFAAMGTRFLAGRDFEESDGTGRLPVAIANAALVDRLFAGDRSLPKRLVRRREDGRDEALTLVGIVEDVQFPMLGQVAAPTVFVPAAQQVHRQDRLLSAVLVVRPRPGTAIGPALASLLAREAVPFSFTTRPFASYVERTTGQIRLLSDCAIALAVVSTVMAIAGMFGASVHWAARRRRELGVRLALGAVPADIVMLVVRQATWRAMCGIVPGLVGSWWLLRAASSWVFGARADMAPLVTAGFGLTLVLLLSTAWPAIRAARLAPADVLRAE